MAGPSVRARGYSRVDMRRLDRIHCTRLPGRPCPDVHLLSGVHCFAATCPHRGTATGAASGPGGCRNSLSRYPQLPCAGAAVMTCHRAPAQRLRCVGPAVKSPAAQTRALSPRPRACGRTRSGGPGVEWERRWSVATRHKRPAARQISTWVKPTPLVRRRRTGTTVPQASCHV